MSVWVAGMASPEAVWELEELPLPFAGYPDLSGVGSEQEMQRLVALLHPDKPPESIIREAEKAWRIFSALAVEDLVLVPSYDTRMASLAQVVQSYRYREEGGEDMHSASVRWLKHHIPFRKINMLSNVLVQRYSMIQVEHPDQRKQIYHLLDRPYNRFAKWRWILGVAIAMQVIVMLIGTLRGQ